MKRYPEVLLTASLTCLVTGALAQDPGEYSSGQSAMPPPPPQLQSAPAEGDAAFFYETLQPYGNWAQVSPFGPVWRPYVAVKDTSWRPYYTGGRWIWSNNAWYWESEYEWGWAPFHYGRWILSNNLGWVWVPGRTWSAAWVNWRRTSTHYDWAPLPPERSLYIGVSSTTDNGITWGFQFGLTQSHYISAPCGNFREVVYVRDNDRHRYHDYRNNDCDRKPQYEHRNDQPVVETRRPPEPSRRTTIMRQVVTSNTSSTSAGSSRTIQQVVSQPRTTTRGSSENTGSTGGSSSRSSRIADIMARSRK